MAKITINDILASFAATVAIDARFQQVEDEFNSKVLYRNNPVGEANEMNNDLDMNNFTILNAIIDSATTSLDAVTLAGEPPSFYLNRANHTGTLTNGQFAGTQVGLAGDIAGKADSADKLETGRTINGTTFDGTLSIATDSFTRTINPTDPTMFVRLLADNSVGVIPNYSHNLLTYNATTNTLGSTLFAGDLIGNSDTTTLADNSTLFGGFNTGQFLRSDVADSGTNLSLADTDLTGTTKLSGTALTASAVDLNRALHFPDSASPVIANVATRSLKVLAFDGAGDLTYTSGIGSTSAALVSILDTGGFYSGSDVEAALQEIGPSLAQTILTDVGVSGLTIGSNAVVDTLPSITVAVGDILLVNLRLDGNKGGTAGMVNTFIKQTVGSTATASVFSGINRFTLQGYYPASSFPEMNGMASFVVTGAGTLTFEIFASSDGSDVTSGVVQTTIVHQGAH